MYLIPINHTFEAISFRGNLPHKYTVTFRSIFYWGIGCICFANIPDFPNILFNKLF